MRLVDEGSTSPTLLREVADWENHPAWVRFRDRYDPHLRSRCRRYDLDDDAIDEVCQLIWIEPAARLRDFCYNPNGSFRGLLDQVCHWRVLDFLRRRAVRLVTLDDRDGDPEADELVTVSESAESTHGPGVAGPFRSFLIDEAEKVQAAVRAKVSPRTWEAFWAVAVQGWTVEGTARALGMTHVAVYAARARVARMLGDEGKRVLGHRPTGT
jgi:DNA-directed RNA polymerase specialized sigma24 family protein